MSKKIYSCEGPLPLVEYILKQGKKINLKNVKIIGVQHILDTTVSMFDSLFDYGLIPANVYLLGKCYSTNESSFNKLIKRGVNVSLGSYEYDSHISFDHVFEKNINTMIADFIESLSKSGSTDLIIVLDDGGKCLLQINNLYKGSIPIVGIEQTTDGINTIIKHSINFPVISVARHPLKLQYESPMIAQAIIEKILEHLPSSNLLSKSCLIIGGGAIGLEIYKKAAVFFEKIDIYDLNSELSTLTSKKLEEILPNYDCIIGCTGQKTISNDLYRHLRKGVILISASSSDREFDALQIRKQIERHSNCHLTINTKDITLLNGGFPVNFDGAEENIDPYLIQFTIALMTSAIMQAFQKRIRRKKGIFILANHLANKVKDRFLKFILSKQQPIKS